MKLYSYFRSSASFRVRIALGLKGLPFEIVPVHLLRSGGEQFKPEYRQLNPAGLVPTLDDDGTVLQQSLAIIEYLDERHPSPPLLPAGAGDRARVRAIALAIACEIHPLNNLRTLKYLTDTLGASEEAKTAWYRHWAEDGLAAVEAMLAGDGRSGRFCHGDEPTLADCCLVPQIFNAQRFECRLGHVPRVMRVFDTCMTLPAFQRATPMAQPDANA